MTHRISAATQSEELPYLQRLWDHLLAPDPDLGSKLDRVFASETDEFELEFAFLSRIDLDAETEHFEVVHSPDDRIETGETVQLSCTYCRKTIAHPEGTVAVSDARAEGQGDDPAYDRFGFGTYVGTTVTVEGDLYGTLCFANQDPRNEPIVDEEITLVEMIGQWATYELNQWTGPPTHDTISNNLGGQDRLDPSAVDSMMDALAKRPRRQILLSLLANPTETSVTLLERAADRESAQAELQHVHFPKLDHAGYIEWDREANSYSRGPNFSGIEPLLRLLQEFTTEAFE